MSAAEDLLVWQIKVARLPEPQRETCFALPRKWRFDLSWPMAHPPLAVEVEGGIWVSGRHVTGKGYESDLEKYAVALLYGWRVLRVSPRMVQDGRALKWIEELLKKGEA